MRHRGPLLIGIGLAGVAVLTGALVLSDPEAPAAAAQAGPMTARVERGPLSAAVSQDGILMYRARPDGAPYVVTNRASGTYTALPEVGDEIRCGGVLYRVDQRPVVLLCGKVPMYRMLRIGRTGEDVRQLNRNLRALGYAVPGRALTRADERRFTTTTAKAVGVLQRRKGVAPTGRLSPAEAVFLPERVRVAKVVGEVGAMARPGTPVLSATSSRLHVQVNLDPSRQRTVERGDRALITLPGNETVRGRVDGFGRVAQTPTEPGARATDATIPLLLRLDEPGRVRRLDRAPVQVDITTRGVDDALSVPVTAIVGKAGGGFAVEVVRAGGRRELAGVRLGLFDTGGGRVQVEGAVREGDRVIVPSL